MDFVVSPEAIHGEQIDQVLSQMMAKISEGIAGISISFLEQIQRYYPQVWQVIETFTHKLLSNFEYIYEKGMKEGSFKVYNMQLLLALDKHFIMSLMTDTKQFSTDGLSLQALVSEYLELRVNALRK